jgi:UPF0716 protein FxsA
MRFLAIFALISLAEMATFFWVESKIGLPWALGLAIITAIIGSLLVRRAGISVFGRLKTRVSEGGLPTRELSDGAAVLVAGAFLISPGFLTDLTGFLLLVPAIQGVVYRQVSKRFTGRVAVFTNGFSTDWVGSPVGDVIDVEPAPERVESRLDDAE